jgi:hypothetical protein
VRGTVMICCDILTSTILGRPGPVRRRLHGCRLVLKAMAAVLTVLTVLTVAV